MKKFAIDTTLLISVEMPVDHHEGFLLSCQRVSNLYLFRNSVTLRAKTARTVEELRRKCKKEPAILSLRIKRTQVTS
jgi:hypothetical protein